MTFAPDARAGASTESCSMADTQIAFQPAAITAVVGFRRAAGEHDLAGLGADECAPPARAPPRRWRARAGPRRAPTTDCRSRRARRASPRAPPRAAAPTRCSRDMCAQLVIRPPRCLSGSGGAASFVGGMPSTTSCSETFARNAAMCPPSACHSPCVRQRWSPRQPASPSRQRVMRVSSSTAFMISSMWIAAAGRAST